MGKRYLPRKLLSGPKQKNLITFGNSRLFSRNETRREVGSPEFWDWAGTGKMMSPKIQDAIFLRFFWKFFFQEIVRSLADPCQPRNMTAEIPFYVIWYELCHMIWGKTSYFKLKQNSLFKGQFFIWPLEVKPIKKIWFHFSYGNLVTSRKKYWPN